MGKVYRAQKDPNKAKKQAVEDENKVLPSSPLSDAAMERLAQIMNDSPTIVKLQGTESINMTFCSSPGMFIAEKCGSSV